MIRVEITETIERSVEAVFARLVDIDAYPDWMPDGSILVTCRRESPEPVGVGTTYSDRTRLGTVRGEVVAFERPRRVVFHYVAEFFGVRVMEGWPGYTLERAGEDRTRVRHRAEGRLYGLFRLFRPLMQKLAERERRLTVAGLKASLERARTGRRPR